MTAAECLDRAQKAVDDTAKKYWMQRFNVEVAREGRPRKIFLPVDSNYYKRRDLRKAATKARKKAQRAELKLNQIKTEINNGGAKSVVTIKSKPDKNRKRLEKHYQRQKQRARKKLQL